MIIVNYRKYGEPTREATSVIKTQELEWPEKMTVAWLFRHVPISFWVWAVGVVVAVFSAGLWFASTEMYSQLRKSAEAAWSARK